MSRFYTDDDRAPVDPQDAYDRVGRRLLELERECGPEEAGRIWNSSPRHEHPYLGDALALPRDTPGRDLDRGDR
jgi:hypothetical protein